MKLVSMIILNGTSFWGDGPVAKCSLTVPEINDVERQQLEERWQFCQKLVPALANKQFKQEDLLQAFIALAINLQSDPRHPLHKPEKSTADNKNVFSVGIPFDIRDMVRFACLAAAAILTPNGILNIPVNNKNKELSTQQSIVLNVLQKYQRDTRHLRLDDDPAWAMREFRKRDIPCEFLFDNFLMLGQGKHQSKIFHSYGKDTSYLSVQLSRNKHMAYELFKSANLPVPPQEIVSSPQEIAKIVSQIGFPVVVKPLRGKQGQDVYINLKSMADVTDAFQRVKKRHQQIIIEKFIPGDEYRLLVIAGKFIAAANRMPGRIIGTDGQTIRQLLVDYNKPYFGNDIRKLYQSPIKLDKTASDLMRQKGYSLETILADGEVLILRKVSNLSAGGKSKDVTDIIHPDVKFMAERAARTINLDVMGLDYITTDITKSPFEIEGGICEVNACPGLRAHYAAVEGPLQDVTTPLINLHYPDGAISRIINIVVCANAPPEKLSNTINRWLQDQDCCAGFYSSGHLSIATAEPDLKGISPLQAADIFNRHTSIDICLWSISYAHLSEIGLPQDKIDLVIDCDDITKFDATLSLKKMINDNSKTYQQIRKGAALKVTIPKSETSNEILPTLVSAFGN